MMKYYVKGGAQPRAARLYRFERKLGSVSVANKLETLSSRSLIWTSRLLRIERSATRSSPWSRRRMCCHTGCATTRLHAFGFAAEIQSLMNPVAPFGSALETTVEDLQAQTRIKVQRARQAVSVTTICWGSTCLKQASGSMCAKPRTRNGTSARLPQGAWLAFRKLVPLEDVLPGLDPSRKPMIAAAFVKATPASTFLRRRQPARGAPMTLPLVVGISGASGRLTLCGCCRCCRQLHITRSSHHLEVGSAHLKEESAVSVDEMRALATVNYSNNDSGHRLERLVQDRE